VARARTSRAARSHRREPLLVQHLLEGPCPDTDAGGGHAPDIRGATFTPAPVLGDHAHTSGYLSGGTR
jgi:hypothetical protein